jgi:hypothetical protein
MLGFIGSYDSQLESYIESMSRDLNLLHIQTKQRLSTRFSFNIYPSIDVVCNAFVDLIELFQWKHAAIIYNLETSKITI